MSIDNALFNRIQLQHFSVNKLIQWGDHFSVDHSGIDAQHKAIFDIGTDIYERWREGGRVDKLRPMVDRLASLLATHFLYEERLLVEIGYDRYDEHVAEHRSMLADMSRMKERFHLLKDGQESSGGSLLAPGWSIMQLLLGFSIGHVISSDMDYCKTLNASRDFMPGTA